MHDLALPAPIPWKSTAQFCRILMDSGQYTNDTITWHGARGPNLVSSPKNVPFCDYTAIDLGGFGTALSRIPTSMVEFRTVMGVRVNWESWKNVQDIVLSLLYDAHCNLQTVLKGLLNYQVVVEISHAWSTSTFQWNSTHVLGTVIVLEWKL